MQRELAKIRENFDTKVKKVSTLGELVMLKKEFLGGKGALKKILALLKTLDDKERKKIGKGASDLKLYLKNEIKQQELKLASKKKSSLAKIDISLPGKKIPQGHLHPLTQILANIEKVFESMGFSIFLTPEIETEFYNFDALNVPDDHPARDLWDTFWIEEDQKIPNSKLQITNKSDSNNQSLDTKYLAYRQAGEVRDTQYDVRNTKLLLRTHTTAMQLRYMAKNNPPFRIISPGKCFRYEASDSSHDIQFYQVDGLVIDKDVSISNFKAIIEALFKRIFSSAIKIRMRPGYFPFVEPGFEVDIACYKCQGKDCPVCKGKGWLEIMGAGMVHPEVLKRAGLNPAHWQGFAFGMGVDRIAMIKYGISDIRLFYQNDLRFLKQF